MKLKTNHSDSLQDSLEFALTPGPLPPTGLAGAPTLRQLQSSTAAHTSP